MLCRIVLVVGPAGAALAWSQSIAEYRTSSALAHARSASSLFHSVTVNGEGSLLVTRGQSIPNYGIPRVPCRATLYGNAQTVELRVFDTSLRVEYDAPSGRRVRTARAVEPGDVFDWMLASGMAPDSPTGEAEARGAWQLLVNVAVGGGNLDDPGAGAFAALSQPTITTSTSSGVHPLALGAILVIGLAVLARLLLPLNSSSAANP